MKEAHRQPIIGRAPGGPGRNAALVVLRENGLDLTSVVRPVGIAAQ